MLRKLIPDPLILALLGVLALATLLPATGIAAQIVSACSTAAIVMLFFFVGAKLSRQAIVEGITHWRLHLIILASTFILFPILALLASRVMEGVFPPELWIGIFFLAALPSTVQSSIALTSIAKGNVAAAIASASASQLIGILLTPFLLGLLTNIHGDTVSISGLGKIIAQIFMPFLAGHLMRPMIGEWVARNKAVISITDRGTILLAVYSAFSAAVIGGIWQRLPLPDLINLVLFCLALVLLVLGITFSIARLFGFARADEIVIMFCGTKKSLVQGVPMARVLFSGPDAGLILLPIMLFHQIQLMVCTAIARRYGKMKNDE